MISNKDISDIQKIINYKFNNIETLKECFTHSSYLNKYKTLVKLQYMIQDTEATNLC